MIERVFSTINITERDNSVLPIVNADIPKKVIIGQTNKGKPFIPQSVSSLNEFRQKFGDINNNLYTAYSTKEILDIDSDVIVQRILGQTGYVLHNPIVIKDSVSDSVLAVLHPTSYVDGAIEAGNVTTGSFINTTLGTNQSGSLFNIDVSGSAQTTNVPFTSSLNSTSDKYITNIFGQSPSGQKSAYVLYNFKAKQTELINADADYQISIDTNSSVSYETSHSFASTPWITSQKIDGDVTDLFRFHTISEGTNSNYEIKVGIQNIRYNVSGTNYGAFDVVIRAVEQKNIPFSNLDNTFNESDTAPRFLETYQNVNLNPRSDNYIAKIIGDLHISYDDKGNLVTTGDYRNKSKYVRVEVSSVVENMAIWEKLVPFGYAALKSPLPSSLLVASHSVVDSQTDSGGYNSRIYYGFNYDFTATDNLNFLSPLPTASVDNGTSFNLGDYNQHPSASLDSGAGDLITPSGSTINQETKKFIVPFQGGFDGWKPNRPMNVADDITSTNSFGLSFSSTTSDGYLLYKRAFDIINNKRQFNAELLFTPELNYKSHSNIIDYGLLVAQNRAECFYPFQLNGVNDSVTTVYNLLDAKDNSYGASYFGWVKLLNEQNRPISVPISVLLPFIYANNDILGNKWNAPAGINRTSLTNVRRLVNNISDSDRQLLFNNRINFVELFRNSNFIEGNFTLNGSESSLSDINVRRLVIHIKKFLEQVALETMYENPSLAITESFEKRINSFLFNLFQNQAIGEEYSIVVDDDPELLDRRTFKGILKITPLRAIQFIEIEFNIERFGA